jgi:chromosome segregation ATPase
MTKPKDLMLAVLREIRDEIRETREGLRAELRTTREELSQRIEATNERLDATNEHLGHVDHALLELGQQQRFVVGYLQALTQRDHRFDAELADLRSRVSALESRDPR